MAYVKNIWVDQDVERPKTYEVTNNQDGSITLTDSFGLVTELGTPVNEVNMNHIEDGIDGCAIRKHNLTETFNLGEWVLGGTGNDEGIYKSLVANNTGNPLSDNTKWEKVEMSGGGRNIGEIVASTVPLTDAGLHLLDGALLQYGIYQAFIDYIADLYDSGDYTSLFATESDWQSSVSQYGVCGKFVYDSVSNTVRLPKYGNQIITKTSNISTASTVPVVGNGMTLGLTDGTTNAGLYAWNNHYENNSTTAYGKPVGSQGTTAFINQKSIGITTNSTKSGLVANTSSLLNITNYPLDCYYYIVVATATKTDIEVDIDEIATDLNGKVDKSGDTMTGALKVQSSGNTQISVVNPEIEVGVIPESAKNASYYIKDVNDTILGNFYYRIGTDGDVSVRMYCNDLNHTGDQVGMRFGFDANGNKYCSFPRCTTVPTTTSTANANLYAVIVENYLSGKSWYRVWSDGFIEQGGFYSGSIGQNASVEVTLLKSFKNTNYNPYVSTAHTTGTATAGNIPSLSTYISAKNKFKIVNEGYAMNTMSGVHWRACGY